MGVSAPGNYPGGRIGAVSWTDLSGNFWLMGGVGRSTNLIGNLSDLWKYDVQMNLWTWVKGSNQVNQPGVYGSQGVASASNMPSARSRAVSWIDGAGNFWLMSGRAFINNQNVDLNDLWKFNPQTNQWTWMKGSHLPNRSGVYNIQGVAAPDNTPGAREHAISYSNILVDCLRPGHIHPTAKAYRQFVSIQSHFLLRLV